MATFQLWAIPLGSLALGAVLGDGRHVTQLASPSKVSHIAEDAETFGLASLPRGVHVLLHEARASARLIAHLHLVHDVALRLASHVVDSFPTANINAAAVRFGAAIHDIGKAMHPDELSGAGDLHEAAGEEFLRDQGIDAKLARFARTHGLEPSSRDLCIEDLLVIAADKVWKGKRVRELEERIARTIANTTGKDFWDIETVLDPILEKLSAGADARLEWQARFPV